MVWTDPSTLEITVGDLPRASFANALLDNLAFLYSPPTVTVRLTAAQAVANASDHTIQWSEAAWDTSTGGMWDAGTPGSIVIERAGVYLIVAQHVWANAVGDQSKRDLYVEKNGTDRLANDSRLATSSPAGQVTLITNLAADDYLEVVSRQLSGASLNLQSGDPGTRCTVTWLRPPPPA